MLKRPLGPPEEVKGPRCLPRELHPGTSCKAALERLNIGAGLHQVVITRLGGEFIIVSNNFGPIPLLEIKMSIGDVAAVLTE